MKKFLLVLSAVLLTLSAASVPAAQAADAQSAAVQAAGDTDSRKWAPPLLYHGGPVMTKVKNYLVFWNGGNSRAFDKKYVSLLQQWQKDAKHITVFKSTMQYPQADGQHPTDTAYGATYTNSTTFPGKGDCAKKCVGEIDIERIAVSTAKKNKIKPGMKTIVYVYTPKGVRKCNQLEDDNTFCYDDSEGPNHNGTCGYHNYAEVGSSELVYVYVPYPDPGCYLTDGTQRFPNNKMADAAVNLTSLFQMEAITDPLYNAWYDSNDEGPAENGAECEWLFGPKLPGKKGNSHYNGRTYDVQAQASNEMAGCVVGSAVDGF